MSKCIDIKFKINPFIINIRDIIYCLTNEYLSQEREKSRKCRQLFCSTLEVNI